MFHRRRYGGVSLGVIAIVMASACTTTETTVANATPTPPRTPITRTTIAGLVPPPTQAFEVDFDYGKSYRFVWRQANGIRRWDVLRRDANGVAGVFSVESEFNAAGEAQRLVECLWTDTTTPGRYSAGCSSDRSVDPTMRALVDALRLNVDASFAGPEIQGRPTRCFAMAANEGVDGEFCVDAATAEPLRLFTISIEHPEFNLDLEAEGSPTHDVSLPSPVQPDLEGSFTADVLGLPNPLGVPRQKP